MSLLIKGVYRRGAGRGVICATGAGEQSAWKPKERHCLFAQA